MRKERLCSRSSLGFKMLCPVFKQIKCYLKNLWQIRMFSEAPLGKSEYLFVECWSKAMSFSANNCLYLEAYQELYNSCGRNSMLNLGHQVHWYLHCPSHTRWYNDTSNNYIVLMLQHFISKIKQCRWHQAQAGKKKTWWRFTSRHFRILQ